MTCLNFFKYYLMCLLYVFMYIQGKTTNVVMEFNSKTVVGNRSVANNTANTKEIASCQNYKNT